LAQNVEAAMANLTLWSMPQRSLKMMRKSIKMVSSEITLFGNAYQ